MRQEDLGCVVRRMIQCVQCKSSFYDIELKNGNCTCIKTHNYNPLISNIYDWREGGG